MDLIMLARELGSAIQMDDIYINLKIAKQNIECDEKLQSIISEFNEKKDEINKEIIKDKMDQKKIDKLNSNIGTLYTKINENPKMQLHNKLESEFQKLMNKVNFILSKSSQGEDPTLINFDELVNENGCSGSCSSCSGC